MLDFAYPYFLLILLTIPLVWFLYWLSRLVKRRRLRRFGNPAQVARLAPDASRYKPALKITFQLIALAAVVLVIARPRYGEAEKTDTRSGIEVMIAFDLSRSMLAPSTDNPNSVARLKRARLLLEQLVDRLGNDKVGLVVFAHNAKTLLPLTTDFYSAKLILSDLDPEMMPDQGTSISEAMSLAMKGFSDKKNVHRAIILITDAEDHEGDALEVAKAAKEKNIQVDVIGVGTSKGAMIPIGDDEYLADSEGNTVISKVDEEAAREIAKAGGGVYVNGSSPDALDTLADTLDKLGTSEFEDVRYTVAAEQFPVFAWIALIFLIVDIFLVERKIGWLKNVNFFSANRIKTARTKNKEANDDKTQAK